MLVPGNKSLLYVYELYVSAIKMSKYQRMTVTCLLRQGNQVLDGMTEEGKVSTLTEINIVIYVHW